MNESEKAFMKSTWRWQEHNKVGWPDFLSIDKDGRLVCVEVKRYADDYLEPEQEHVMRLLSEQGIPCYRWDTELGLKPYDYRMPSDELRQLRDKRYNERKTEPVPPHRRKLVEAVDAELTRFRRGLTAPSV